LNKIVLEKNISAIFLAIVLVAGTIVLSSPSFMTTASAQAQPYYGMDKNYDKSYGKDNYKSKDNVIVKKINCNNINVNVNGLELDGLPPFLGNLLASEGQDGYGGASSYGSGSYGVGGQSGYDNDFRFICINNNNNTVIGEEEELPEPPEPITTTLTVTKLVTCEDTRLTPVNGPTCADLLATITENQFNITVGNPLGNVSEFVGSETGTTVTLNPNNYTVTETPDDSVAQEIATLGGNIAGPIPSFTGDCSQAIPGPFEANVPIAAGESQICNIFNNFVISDDSNDLTASASTIIAQGTEEGLSALEKTTKLKQQWLELLP
jgi:hypothetical protein